MTKFEGGGKLKEYQEVIVTGFDSIFICDICPSRESCEPQYIMKCKIEGHCEKMGAVYVVDDDEIIVVPRITDDGI